MSRDMWDPAQYRVYASHRARPAADLLVRVGARSPSYVVDLGCGPGEHTVDLARRWPGAVVEGIDDSEQMIATARRTLAAYGGPGSRDGASPAGRTSAPGARPASRAPAPAPASGGEQADPAALPERVRFTVGDIARWHPDRPVDVIFSSAALHWVPGHQRLLPAWVDGLVPSGWLAFTVPGNFTAPSHVILRELVSSARWRDRLGGILCHDAVSTPGDYLELLSGQGCAVDAWETTFMQVLAGEDPVLDWMKGSALRPVLDTLADPVEREAFLADYGARLRCAYPRRAFGTVFPFRRIFVVAARLAEGE